ncbi:hypothetical protein ABE61_00785 [Lysinibacillus sphaericus]|uniref:DUF4179 domain-containing protein n=1 Tax=Lysinibacillus sphaericus TaxID=1421 RepID=UPI0018CD0489|nr:DUF4179 domain-containing protein [Lysinibacillus sphaericus]MBG9452658.1 hypothetical protein [Lysinibacillus sphaericus]MBG9479874.1 hypothetical protein [Lysinibacillus sphaericus]MBG9595207.1 hypothetical protein [Lysinibacillus sphaericus]
MMSDMLLVENQPKGNLGRKIWFIVVLLLLVATCVIVYYFLFKKELNFEAYKTVVDKTTENALGRLTLNEIIIDDNQILLNATFKPVKDLNFDNQIFFFPQVFVNGKELTVRNGGQTIQQSDKKYTIYSSVKLSELPEDKILNVDIRYNDWNGEKKIDDPWEFQVEASQEQLQEDRNTFSVEKKAKLLDGQEITIEKVVSTPISTTVYFHSEKSLLNEAIHFKIQSASGETWHINSAYPLNEDYTKWGVRLDALYLTGNSYELIPVAKNGSELGSAIKIEDK